MVLVSTSLGLAQDEAPQTNSTDESARRVYAEGRAAFDEGRFEDALRLFEAAYELSPRPQLLYNIGSSADRLRHNERALEAFDGYLEALPEASNRAAVEARIRVLRSDIERSRQLEASLREHQETPDAAPDEPEPTKRRWWIGVLVGGIALAATAVTLGIVLRDDSPDYMNGDDGRLIFTLEHGP